MLDVRLFANPRFTAAQRTVTIAFFALFGFIFLVTQYFQFVLGYWPLEAGVRRGAVRSRRPRTAAPVRQLPPASAPRSIVAAGLLSMAVGFAWTATVGASP